MLEGPRRTESSRDALRIALVYLVFAGMWILLSDRVMGLLFREPEDLVQASLFKGWIFVAVTALLLYGLVRRLVGQLNASHHRALAEAEEKQRSLQVLAAIVNSSGDVIFAKDEQGRYLLVNDAAARSVGRSVDELLGLDDVAVFPLEQAERIMAADRRVIASGETETSEELLHTILGERVFLATRGPLRDVSGKTFGTFGVSRDITERMLAQNGLKLRNAELERFDKASVGRELEMIEMKKTINAMALELGRQAPYRLDFLSIDESRS